MKHGKKHGKHAVLSVSNKAGLIPFAQSLIELGFTILSTGGTATVLRDAGLEVTDVSEYTGFPEIMDGRVKTLHPKVYGGILHRSGIDDEVMSEHDMANISIVACNLYPFAATIAKPDCTFAEAIEQIDIGGPSMVRAAAKNHDDVGGGVTVVTDPADYDAVLTGLRNNPDNPSTSPELRHEFARKAFHHTAAYDAMIAKYFDDTMATEE